MLKLSGFYFSCRLTNHSEDEVTEDYHTHHHDCRTNIHFHHTETRNCNSGEFSFHHVIPQNTPKHPPQALTIFDSTLHLGSDREEG